MKRKKLLILLLIFVILITQIGIMNFINLSSVFAESLLGTEWNRYFYNQLTQDAKDIYDAMFDMYQKGIFAKGESMEITDRVSASSIALFVNGNQKIISDYGAARDAFQYDYPDCFYVNWDNLSVRVTQDQAGTLHAFLGAGRTDTYLLKGMNDQRTDEMNSGHGKGIEGAINEYEAKLQEVVDKIKENASDLTDQNEKIYQMVGDAHDYVTTHMSYKHEWQTTSNPVKGGDRKSTSRTAYDGLILGEGVCEAYTRTFKAICDRLKIPCICVYGIYSPTVKINEPHIWNYVQIDGKWYGVDVTHDDPTVLGGMFEHNTNENRDFFLVGQNQLAAHHFPQGILSSANYEFKYPMLENETYRFSYSVEAGSGFSILVQKDSQIDEYNGNQSFDSGTVYVSYEGLNFTQNAARGKYIVVKYYNYTKELDTWEVSDWSYIDPWTILFGDNERIEEFEPATPRRDSDGEERYYVRLELPQTKRVQFAITEVPPSYLAVKQEVARYRESNPGASITPELSQKVAKLFLDEENPAAYVKGAVVLSDTITDMIENKWGDYVSPPMPTKLTPGGSLYIGQTHHLKMEFNDKLKYKPGENKVGIDITVDGGAGIAGNWNAGHSALDYCKIENINWDGDRTVEFDFTPSTMYADNSCFYNFQVTGLVGNASGRIPVAGTFAFTYPCACFAYAAQGYNRNVYAQPQLMETSDIDMSKWELEDVDTHSQNYGKKETMSEFMDEIAANGGQSQEFLDSLHARLTLVTTETAPAQESAMEEILSQNQKTKDDFKNAKQGTVNTYNISITVCKKMVLKTGESAHISLGFPKGTTYEDFAENGKLSFKAYHYKVDPTTNQLNGEVEEIRVTVTRQGLVLWVDSFSPFTVMAVENENPVPVNQKELFLTSTLGGSLKDSSGKKFEGENLAVKLSSGQSQKVTIESDTGYEIDYIMIDGVRQNITNKKKQNIDINFSDIDTGSVLDVGFVAEQIHAGETKNGYNSTFEIPKITISVDKTAYEFVEGDTINIKPVITVTGMDFVPTQDENFNPETATEQNHPDYIKYQWYDTNRGEQKYYFVESVGQTKQTLNIENAKYSNGGQYYLLATPMKWINGKYEPLKENNTDEPVKVYSDTLRITVYPEINLRLKGADSRLTGDLASGYSITLREGENYKITAEMYRNYETGERTDAREVIWTSSNPEIVSVNESGNLTIKGSLDTPVTITAEVTDINGTTKKTANVYVTTQTIEATGIELDKTTLELEVGQSETLYAKVTPENAHDKNVTWSIEGDGSKYISVNNGVVTANALNEGKETTATVVATTSNGIQARCTVTVKVTYVTSISDDIADHNIYIVEGKTTKIDANVIPETATNKNLKWETSDESVAQLSVQEDGSVIITAGAYKEEGSNECQVKVSAEGAKPGTNVENAFTVIVEKETVKVTNVTLKPDERRTDYTGTLKIGEGIDYNVIIEPENATYSTVEWSVVDGSDVVSIDNSGYVTANKVGTAEIQATVTCQFEECPHHIAIATITVEPEPDIPVDKIELSESNITLTKNDMKTLTATVLPDNATNKNVTWSSDHPEIATVDETGKVTGIAPGKAKISATSGGITATCEVNVIAITVEGIMLDKSELKLKDNDSPVTLQVNYYPEHADNTGVDWESSDPNVVTVENGVITPKAEGEAIVTAKLKADPTIYHECHVTVVPSKTDLVVYTVDQNKKFISDITLRLTKLEGNVERVVKETNGIGKFEFKDLADGEYTIYETNIPTKDRLGNELKITNIVDRYKFTVHDGKILFESFDENGASKFNEINSLVFVNTTDGSDSKVDISENYEGIELSFEEFAKNLPELPNEDDNKPNPDTGNQQPNVNTNPGSQTPNAGANAQSQQPNIGTNVEPQANNQNNNSSNGAQSNPTTQAQADTTVASTPLPKTSDIALGTFIVVMVISFVGIIYIVCKKNKK